MWPQIITGITALIGAGLALLGVLITQRRADRRELEQWRREREREREVWAREDSTRSYDNRRDAYLHFIYEWHRLAEVYGKAVEEYEMNRGFDPEPNHDWLLSLYEKNLAVELFGTEAAQKKAQDASDALDRMARHGGSFPDAMAAIKTFQEQARRDLSVPSGAIELSGDLTL